MIQLMKEMQGTILDIGGGGEGVIGRLYKNQVIAIDNRQEELDEAPNCFEKVLMDAKCLMYQEETFDHVTFFYSLLFMNRKTQLQALSEAARVLKTGGMMHIWDTDVSSAYPYLFRVDLEIQVDGERIYTTYEIINDIINPVSYTHLDVYKRQGFLHAGTYL